MPYNGYGVGFQKWIFIKISMKIVLTLIMELAGFFILLMWTLKGQLVRISELKRKQKLKSLMQLGQPNLFSAGFGIKI